MSAKAEPVDPDHPSEVFAAALTTPTAPRAHFAPQRGVDVLPSSSFRSGRFGRMFRNLPVFELQEEWLSALAERMTVDVDASAEAGAGGWEQQQAFENPNLPAGYTYLGQFVDHDITFDPVSSLQRQNDPDALHNFRTPRYDLDSLYGAGPADQPYLYRQGPHLIPADGMAEADVRGVKFLLGRDPNVSSGLGGFDLPRNDEQRALTGDPRNDENLIVSQLHSVFLRFHNAIVEHVASTTSLRDDNLFKEAQRLTRWHYQWVVARDFLPRIVGPETVNRILGDIDAATSAETEPSVRRPVLQFYRPAVDAYMPVEFSVAAYRFGHSMIRPSYFFNDFVKQATGGQPTPIFSDDPNELANLNGFRRLPDDWAFDWKFFFDVDPSEVAQRSFLIDTRLAKPLSALPGTVNFRSLAHLNLLRGLRLGLASGPSVARAMGVVPLTDDELGIADISPELSRQAPLWYYVLKEAETKGDGGKRLGAVGGNIVAEVLIGLLASDRLSYLNVEPNWRPDPALAPSGVFEMADLIRFALAS